MAQKFYPLVEIKGTIFRFLRILLVDPPNKSPNPFYLLANQNVPTWKVGTIRLTMRTFPIAPENLHIAPINE